MNCNIEEDSSLSLGMTRAIFGSQGKQRQFAGANRLCFLTLNSRIVIPNGAKRNEESPVEWKNIGIERLIINIFNKMNYSSKVAKLVSDKRLAMV
jgi:hypothetical protein